MFRQSDRNLQEDWRAGRTTSKRATWRFLSSIRRLIERRGDQAGCRMLRQRDQAVRDDRRAGAEDFGSLRNRASRGSLGRLASNERRRQASARLLRQSAQNIQEARQREARQSRRLRNLCVPYEGWATWRRGGRSCAGEERYENVRAKKNCRADAGRPKRRRLCGVCCRLAPYRRRRAACASEDFYESAESRQKAPRSRGRSDALSDLSAVCDGRA